MKTFYIDRIYRWVVRDHPAIEVRFIKYNHVRRDYGEVVGLADGKNYTVCLEDLK